MLDKIKSKIRQMYKSGFCIRRVSGSLLSVEDGAIIALDISDKLNHNEREQAMFVAGFQEGIKYIRKFGNVR